MIKGRCVVCGEMIPNVLVSGQSIGHCMHVDALEWHPAQFTQKTVYNGIWICHGCASRISENIAANAANFGLDK